MPSYAAVVPLRPRDHGSALRVRGSPRTQEETPANGTYRADMPSSPTPAQDVRRAAFARFVQRVIRHVRTAKGWTIPDLAREAGIGDSTIYRWRDGDWKEDPKGGQVKAFCDAADVPTSAALSILWPSRDEKPAEPEPIALDPELETLARRLRDPNVPDAEKYLIRETIRGLAARSTKDGRATG